MNDSPDHGAAHVPRLMGEILDTLLSAQALKSIHPAKGACQPIADSRPPIDASVQLPESRRSCPAQQDRAGTVCFAGLFRH